MARINKNFWRSDTTEDVPFDFLSDMKKKISYVVITYHPWVKNSCFLVDVKNSTVPRHEKIFLFYFHRCIFVRRTFMSWSLPGLSLRLEMAAIFLAEDRFLRFTFNGGFSVFLLSSTKLLWCFLNCVDPTFNQSSSLLSILSF